MSGFWNIAKQELESNYKLVLMYVIDSNGSSPGRQGFKMLVSSSSILTGSIGGGFMEHKLVELCKNDLLSRDFKPFIKKQIHKDSIAKDKSGMICSGEQTIAFYLLTKSHLALIDKITNATKGLLVANNKDIRFEATNSLSNKFDLEITETSHWELKENIGAQLELHIVGGGHVGLALSKIASELEFSVNLYDDREGLNTIQANSYAKCIVLDSYTHINKLITSGANKYVVLMTFGYRTDKLILKQLLTNDYAYVGMMGSKAKVTTLYKEFLNEGITQKQLNCIHAPIGLAIASKTPTEIAISILAELIQVKNS